MATELKEFATKECCILCKERHIDELVYGAVYKLGQVVVHYFCLLLSTDTVQQGEDEEGILGFLPKDILCVVQKSSKLSCTICQHKGATIRCTKCRAMFHYPCGIREGSSHQFYGQFRSFCPSHRIHQKIPKSVTVKDTCNICLENVQLSNNNVIWAPCCKKNGFFHRNCLQRMAYSFGRYMLKCPLCNNRTKFLQAIEYHGIYIPQQDAAWEVEPNAFSELMERYNRCDAKKCFCPKGRNYSQALESANWKILLCTDCGSHGAHRKCISAGTHPKWKCNVCRNIESASHRNIESASHRKKREFSHVNTSERNVDNESEVKLHVTDTRSSFDVVVNKNHQNSNAKSTKNIEKPTKKRSLDYVTVENQNNVKSDGVDMDINSANNNVTYQYTSSRKRHVNGEIVHKETVFSNETIHQQQHGELSVKRRKIETTRIETSTAPQLELVKSFELSPIIVIDSDDDKDKNDEVICIDSDDEIVQISKNKCEKMVHQLDLTKKRTNVSKDQLYISKKRSKVFREWSNVTKESSNVFKELSNVSKEWSSVLKQRPNVPKEQSNESNERSNVSEERSSVLKQRSNVPKEQSNVSNEQSNESNERSNVSEERSSVLKQRSNVPKEQSNVSNELSNVSKEWSSVLKQRPNVPKEQSNESNERSNVSEERSSVLKQRSNVPKEQSNVSNELSNVSEEWSSVLKQQSNVTKEQSNVSHERSNVSKELSRVLKQWSRVLKQRSNVPKEQSNVSNELSNVSKERSSVLKQRSNVPKEQSNVSNEQSNVLKQRSNECKEWSKVSNELRSHHSSTEHSPSKLLSNYTIVKRTTTTNKVSNGRTNSTSNSLYSQQPKLQSVKPERSQMESVEAEYTKRQMFLCSDEHGNYLEVKLNKLQQFAEFSVSVTHRGRAEKCLNVLEEKLNQVDVSVILIGSEDVAKNEAEKYLSAIEGLITRNMRSRFIIIDLPVRYDRPQWAFINRNIRKTNDKLQELFKKYENVAFVHLSEAGRRLHSVYGKHLTYKGKVWLTQQICRVAKQFC